MRQDDGESLPTARIDKIKRVRKSLRCSICPPNRGENASRKPKYGVQKSRKRIKRGKSIQTEA